MTPLTKKIVRFPYHKHLTTAARTSYWFILPEYQLTGNRLSVNPTKWSNTLKQFVGKLPMNCLSVFDHILWD